MPSAYETRSEAFFRLYEGETPQEIQTLLTRWIPKGGRVLELACGSSRDARFMSGLGAIVEATDGSGPLLKLAEARHEAGISAPSRPPSPCFAFLPTRVPKTHYSPVSPALTPSTPAEFFSICPTMNSMKAHASWSVLSRTRAR